MSEQDYSELGKEVAIGSVGKELRVLWDEDSARTNASLMNLAVYSEASGALFKNSQLVQEITREHACRAILIGIDRSNPDASIRAWITAHCHLKSGQKSVCCEQLAFHLTGRATGRLRNTVFAHLNSDLPLVFWWQGELSDIFSERLYSLIERFVFDSSEWKNPAESFEKIQLALESAAGLTPLDMEWTRSYPIRLALASLFDDPLAIEELPNIKQLSVSVQKKHRMAGLQLIAWIAHCSEWDLVSAHQQVDSFIFTKKNADTVVVHFSENEISAPVSQVELISEKASISVRCDEGAAYLQQRLEVGAHLIERSMPMGDFSPQGLLMSQLSRGGKNSLYREILPLFRRLLVIK